MVILYAILNGIWYILLVSFAYGLLSWVMA